MKYAICWFVETFDANPFILSNRICFQVCYHLAQRKFNHHPMLSAFLVWLEAWKAKVKYSFSWEVKSGQSTSSNGSHSALFYQQSSQQTVPPAAEVMRATAHHYNLPSSFTHPIQTYKQRLGTPIKCSQSPSLQPTCGYCMWEVRWGLPSFPAETCGVFYLRSSCHVW